MRRFVAVAARTQPRAPVLCVWGVRAHRAALLWRLLLLLPLPLLLSCLTPTMSKRCNAQVSLAFAAACACVVRAAPRANARGYHRSWGAQSQRGGGGVLACARARTVGMELRHSIWGRRLFCGAAAARNARRGGQAGTGIRGCGCGSKRDARPS